MTSDCTDEDVSSTTVSYRRLHIAGSFSRQLNVRDGLDIVDVGLRTKGFADCAL